MNKYQITKQEYHFLVEMINYLNDKDTVMSEKAAVETKDVFMRICSRPVLDIIIDRSVLGRENEDKYMSVDITAATEEKEND